MNSEEIWAPIKQSRGYYSVSNMGRVRNNHTGRIIKTFLRKDGYRMVSLSGGYEKIGSKKVSRLVVDAFLGAEGHGMWKHKNGDRSDDRVENLEEM